MEVRTLEVVLVSVRVRARVRIPRGRSRYFARVRDSRGVSETPPSTGIARRGIAHCGRSRARWTPPRPCETKTTQTRIRSTRSSRTCFTPRRTRRVRAFRSATLRRGSAFAEGVRGPRPFAFGIRIVAIIAWCATCALLTRIGYVPAATFHGARFFADDEAAAAFEERLLASSSVDDPAARARRSPRFSPSRGAPRLTSSSAYPGRCLRTWMAYRAIQPLRRRVPCWPSSASSFRRHWSGVPRETPSPRFISRRYDEAPLPRQGARRVALAVAFSTLFHGFETRWLVWGAVNAAGLTIERLIDDSYPGWRFHARGATWLPASPPWQRRHVRHGGDVRGDASTRRRGRGWWRGSSRDSSRRGGVNDK